MLEFEVPAMESARVRSAGKDLLSLALMDARNRTLRWIGAFEQAFGPALKVPPANDRNPPLWELGRIGWYQERWIARNVQRDRGERCNPSQTRLASLLPDADRWFDAAGGTRRAGRWSLDLPDLQSTKQYLVDTLETTLELLDGTHGDDDARLYFYRLALLDEDRHAEVFAVAAQTLGIDTGLVEPPGGRAPLEPLLFPATRWLLGTSGGGFVFDNEQTAHEVRIPEFEIDAQPVTWSQYCEFVEDGGYDEPRFWTDAGWAWLKREGRRTPRYVDQMRQGVLQRRFGRLARVPMAQPAMHVCWHEADAWCRWAGRRLPTEVEWEAAAHQGASRGFQWGTVWEWTATTFRPYPGFVAGPDRDYSVPSFGNAKVLRGASFATRSRLRSAKFRHFASGEVDAQFCGFRSCSI